ncbi:U3 snoRNP protein, partial [Dispira parvispora]
MAYLFKYLLKLIITDLRPTFRIIMCLLGKEYEKPHIRRFAAESFAFLLRKCNPQQMSTILTYMLQCYSESSTVTFQQGLLLLFTEAVKSVSGRLHSKTGRLFTVLLDNLHQEEVTAEEPESGCVYQLTVAFIKIVWQNFQKEDLVVLWTVLHRDLQRIAQLLREQEGAPEERTLQDLLQTTGLWLVAVTVNKGSRVLDFKPWMSELNALEDLVSVVDAHDSDTGKAVSQLALQVQHNLAHVGLSMLLFAPLEVSMSSGKVFLDRLFTQRSPAVVLPFALSLAKLGWVHFNSILLPYLIRYTQRHWRTHFDEVVLFWNRVFALNILTLKPDQVSRYLNTHGQVCFPLSTEKSNDEPQTEGMTLQAQGFVEALLAYLQLPFDWQLTGEQLVHQRYYDKAQSNSRHATAEETDPDAMLAEYSSEDGDDDESDGSLSSNDSNVTSLTNALPLSTVLNLLSFVEVPVVPALEALSELTQSLSEALVAYGDAGDTDLEAPGSEFALQCLMGQLVQTQMKLLEIQGDIEPDRLESYWVPYMDKNFKYCRRCPVYLRAIVSYLQLVQKVPTLADTHLDSEGLQHFYPILIENVSSFYHELRSPTLAILAFFQPLPLNTPEEKLQLGQRVVPGKESKTCPIVSLALEVEDTPATLDQYRDKLNPLRRMLTLYLAHRVPDLYLDLLPRLCLSMLSVNFKLVWQEAIDGFQQLARVYPTVAWQLLFQEIERFEYQRRLFEFRFPMSIEKSYVTQRDTTSGPRRLPRAALFLSGVRSQCTYWLRYRFFVGQHQALFKSSRVTQGLWYQFIKNCEIETTRMDYWNYFQQIMQTLLSVNHLAEQHYKPLMTIFLRFVYQHYPYLPNDLVFHHLPDGTPLATLVARIFEQNGPLGTDEVGGTVTMPTVQNQPGLAVKNNPKVVLYKLTQYLILLSRFRNPLTIQKTAYLQPIFLNLLTKGDHSLQSLALECLVSWRASSSLSPYKGRLRRLLLDRKCRDELTKFDLSPAATKRNIKPMDRPEVIMALVRLLAGRLMDQKGRRAHSAGITARRTAILNALTLLPPEELQPFFDILVEPFRVAWAKMTQTDRASRLPHEWLADFGEFRVQYDSQGVFQMNLDQNFVRWVDSNVQLGFVNMLYHLIKQMKTRVIPFIPLMLSILLHMVAEVEQQLTNLSGADGFEVAADTDEMMESDVMDEDLMDEEEESASELGSQGSSDEEEVVNGEESEDEVDEAVDSGIEVASDDNQSDDEIEPDDESFITQDLSANHSRRSRGGHSRSKVKALRQLRQFITHRIRQLFELTSGYDFVPFLPAIFTHVINPRLSSLTDENIQSPSALLKLVESWSLQPQYLDYLSAYNADLLPRLLDLLSKSKVRSTVVYLVLDMVQNILEMAQFRQETPSNQNELPSLTTGTLNPSQAMLLDDIPRYQAVAETLLRSYMEPLLAHFSTLLHRQNFTGKSVSNIGGVPRRLISLLAQLGEFVDHPEYARQLLQDLLPLVRKTSRTISEELRHNVLDIFSAFLPLLTDQLQGGFSQSPLYCEYYDFVSRMFATLKAPDSRTRLVGLFQQLATIDNGQQLPHVVDLVADMNRYVMGGEPDYNCRLSAYARLNETLYQQLTVREWLPVLCNLTFYINDVEELAFRNHSSFGIIRFTECVAQQHSKCSDVSSHDDPERLAYTEMVRMLGNVVYNTLQRQLSAPDETIRLEWLRVLAKLVEICPFFGNLGHLQVLFMKDQEEEERNFFENIYHVQTYRRVRALQDLTVICEDSQSPITPKLLYSVIIPIISHFIAPAQGKQEVQLAEETIQALAVIARHLPWDQYRHLVSSFLRRATASKIPPSEQVEAAVAILNVFHFDVTLWQEYSELNDSLVEVPDTEDKSSESGDISPTDAEDAVEDEDVGSEGEDETLSDQEGEGMVEESQSSAYAQALQSKRIHDTILLDFLPRFKKFLGSGAHSSPKIRVRIALPATVLLRRLPPQSYKNHLPGLITTVCNLLRSKAQNTRTVTRETLVTMVRILKAEFLSFVLKELKSSLRRGFQRHVLGFTAHAILEAVIQQGVQPGELDDCVEPALDILVDDIFGDLAQEKRVTGITNTTEEAKACMSLHSFELLAQSVSFSRVGELLVPLKGLLSETENKTTMEKVDEVLQGISQGLYRNPGVELRDLLVFCHGLITRNLALTVNKEKEHALKWNQNREDPLYTVYTSVAQFRGTKDYFSVNVHRFTNFGLGLLLRVVKDSHRLQTVEVDKVNLLDPFVDIVGN